MIRRWIPSSVAAPAGQYSHLAAVPAGHELVFVSGQQIEDVAAIPTGR